MLDVICRGAVTRCTGVMVASLPLLHDEDILAGW